MQFLSLSQSLEATVAGPPVEWAVRAVLEPAAVLLEVAVETVFPEQQATAAVEGVVVAALLELDVQVEVTPQQDVYLVVAAAALMVGRPL